MFDIPGVWVDSVASGVNASSKLGDEALKEVDVQRGVPFPTGEESGRGNFFVVWSRNGVLL